MPAMIRPRLPALLLACVLPTVALAQAPNPAEERARLANQRIEAEAARKAAEEEQAREERARLANERIQVEAARRAEEERARQEFATQAAARPPADAGPAPGSALVAVPSAPASQIPASEPPPVSPGARAARDAQTTRALEQLRQLGELRDAGYVTEQEFDRIKNRILDDRF